MACGNSSAGLLKYLSSPPRNSIAWCYIYPHQKAWWTSTDRYFALLIPLTQHCMVLFLSTDFLPHIAQQKVPPKAAADKHW